MEPRSKLQIVLRYFILNCFSDEVAFNSKQFYGSKAISSNQVFGREEDETESSNNSKLQALLILNLTFFVLPN